MKGTIIKIIENDFGQEYGFIQSDGTDYYFDNRYLTNGSMSDFYVDDDVDFQPGTNHYNASQNIAKKSYVGFGQAQRKRSIAVRFPRFYSDFGRLLPSRTRQFKIKQVV